MQGGIGAVVDVDDAPLSVQPAAIGSAKATAASVVHVGHRESSACPELYVEPESRVGARCRTSMNLHQKRWQFVCWRGESCVGRTVEVGEGSLPFAGRILDRLRGGDILAIYCQPS